MAEQRCWPKNIYRVGLIADFRPNIHEGRTGLHRVYGARGVFVDDTFLDVTVAARAFHVFFNLDLGAAMLAGST
jgi:tRNA splicing ligase